MAAFSRESRNGSSIDLSFRRVSRMERRRKKEIDPDIFLGVISIFQFYILQFLINNKFNLLKLKFIIEFYFINMINKVNN